MEAGPPGKNHNGAARTQKEWQLRLDGTKRRVKEKIVAIQKEFSGVTEPSERRPLNGKPAEEFSITPEEILNKLATLELGESSEGYVDGKLPTPHYADLVAVNPKTGETWSVRINPSGSVKFTRVVKPEETPPDVESLRYVPRLEHFVSGNGSGQGSWTKEPATLTIIGKNQEELVFRAPVTEPVPTSSHPS